MDIKIINTERVLSPTQIKLADYVINPYRGCEFGCLYCYSRENKNIKKDCFFMNFLGVKKNSPEILEKELKQKKPKRVLLGSTTECFQYQEQKYKITEKILQILSRNKIPCTILTKSHLIINYLSLLQENKENKIYFTYNLVSDKIRQLVEKKSSPLQERLKAIAEIITYGIDLRVHIGPFIPYLSCFDFDRQNNSTKLNNIQELENILKILPKDVKELDIELYHEKQGNFQAIVDTAKKNISMELSENLCRVYENENNYIKFAQDLKQEIEQLSDKYSFNFYYIVPDFNKFYTPYIDYEKSLF